MFTRYVRPILLAAALGLPSAGCSDSIMTPEAIQAQAANATDRELLVAILARLDAMEARVEQEAGTVRAALEAITGVEDLRVAFAPGNNQGNQNPGTPGGGTNQGVTGGLDEVKTELASLKSMTNNLFTLAEWMALEMASPWSGLETCFAAKLKGNADLKSLTHAQGDGEGGLGVKPWDTGALASLRIRKSLGAEFALGAEMEIVGLGGCLNWGNLSAAPPVRPGPSPVSAQQTGLPAALMNVPGQLGLDDARLQQILTTGTSILQSGDLTRVEELASVLPVPSQLRNPLPAVRNQLQSIDFVDLLCGSNFGPKVAGYVSQGCGYIQTNNLPNLGVYLNLGSNFSNLQANFGSLCGRFNNVVDQRLVINNNLPWGGSNVLDVALFPANWNVTC